MSEERSPAEGAEAAEAVRPRPMTIRRDVKITSRVVVREMIYHQESGSDPTSVTSGFVRRLSSDEQPWIRQMKAVGPEWTPLECGWLTAASVLLLTNEKGPPVELGLMVADVEPPGGSRTAWSPPRRMEPLIARFAVIAEGESARFTPADLALLRVRCVGEGGARCVLRLYPE